MAENIAIFYYPYKHGYLKEKCYSNYKSDERSSPDITLQVMAQSVELGQHEVNILFGLGLVGDDGPEEVGQVAKRLVADHHASCFHHSSLNIEQNSITICQFLPEFFQ